MRGLSHNLTLFVFAELDLLYKTLAAFVPDRISSDFSWNCHSGLGSQSPPFCLQDTCELAC